MKLEADHHLKMQPRWERPDTAHTGLASRSMCRKQTSRVSLLCFVAVLLASLLLCHCSKEEVATTIADIRSAPSSYSDKRVIIRGEVTDAFGIFSFGLYEFKDQTGDIQVLTMGGLPAVGSRFTLYGTVMTGLTISGRNYGTAIRESERSGDSASLQTRP